MAVVTATTSCYGQEAAEKLSAYTLFHHGKARQAIGKVNDLIRVAPTDAERAFMERDLLEMCAEAYDWACVGKVSSSILQRIQADRSLLVLIPDVIVANVRMGIWFHNPGIVDQALKDGSALRPVNSATHPHQSAQLQIALHGYYLGKNDLIKADEALSSAVLDLLLMDKEMSAWRAQDLIAIIGALIGQQDIVGAFGMVGRVDPFISKMLPHDSVAYAHYRLFIGQLLAFTTAYADTASALQEAAQLFDALEIDSDVRMYRVATANSLASAALVMAGKPEDARQVHAGHPLQKEREAILGRGEFQSTTEFFFAVSDVFLASVSKDRVDLRWKELFQKGIKLNFGDIEQVNMNSYRDFALGLLALAASDQEESHRLLMLAAKQRIDNFETVLRGSLEGFQLPSVVDRIVVETGMTVAIGRGHDLANAELVLRGSEVINRNTRHYLGDVAVLLGSQRGPGERKTAHSYIHLVRDKREWELNKIQQALEGNLVPDRAAISREYEGSVAELGRAKRLFQAQPFFGRSNGLPTIDALRNELSDADAFVTLFPTMNGLGKLCITRKGMAYSTSRFEIEVVIGHMRLLELAMTAGHPPDPHLDSQFPANSALYLRDLLFGGLETCLVPGTSVTMALATSLAGIPLGALLAEVPAQNKDGYDLANAKWLIKAFSFSLVVSARQFIAAAEQSRLATAVSRAYLGVGDPALKGASLTQLTGTSVVRGALTVPGSITEFAELPETAEELVGVAALFDANRADILTRERATERAFRARPVSEYDVIHFATHGLLARDIPGLTESALLLTPGNPEDRDDDGLLGASEIERLLLNARLVVLSACNTAKYSVSQATLGVHDLYAAFTVAGVPTVLASLWSVESATARDLVVDFFRDWRPDVSRGAAVSLAGATRRFLAHADIAHQHPRFWAAFVVVGYGGPGKSGHAGAGASRR